MKYLPSQILFFLYNRSTQRNLVFLAKLFCLLACIIALYSVLFHVIMVYEGRNYSWITGIYWSLTVMSTLGFGDITFHSDLGLVFTILVLFSGIVFLLIILPFSFIQFFYAPWLDAQAKSRTPRALPEDTSGHVILTHVDPITEKLIQTMVRNAYQYVILESDPQRGRELHDSGYNVLIGDPDDPKTYRKCRVENAALVVATNDDLMNVTIAFTVRELTKTVPIIASAESGHSLDILRFPGNVQVLEFMEMLGRGLAERTLGMGKALSVISRFGTLQVAEISASRTRLVDRRLVNIGLRPKTGVSVIGIWEKGRFEVPQAQTRVCPSNVLILAGTADQLALFEKCYVRQEDSVPQDAPVLILGGGRVGLAVARNLKANHIPFTIVEKRNILEAAGIPHVHGDAADLNILKQAGISKARSAIITTHTDAMNVYLAFYCRQLRPDIQLISRATNVRNVSKLHKAGADLVLSYASMGANAVVNTLQSDKIYMFTEGLTIFSQAIPRRLAGKTLVESEIRPRTGCNVVAIRAGGNLTVGPDPTLPLDKKDELILMGTTDARKAFERLFKVA